MLNLPEDGILTLPLPADGKTFFEAERGQEPLDLTKTGNCYRIRLPGDCDPLDTVIRLSAEWRDPK